MTGVTVKRLPKKLKVGKEEWSISIEPNDYGILAGVTRWDEKTIYVFEGMDHGDPFELFGTMAHEILHARNKSLSEKAVRETEEALVVMARAIFGIPMTDSVTQ